jgi:alkanesulfonate monooxygenase SsuD/methylene tetrahydromethanopterin reductase-like flavin-dependent oxidoreductase (luciferase family)
LGKHKFGVFLPFYAFKSPTPKQQFQQITTIVMECERLGYDAVWLDDHLMYGNWPILETWTTLTSLAAQTSKIRLGTMVSCIAHRNPGLLAKTAATLDVLSNGRFELGLGTGAQEAEHLAYGFGFPKASVRAEQLVEALEVIKALWTQPKASFNGKYFKLKDAVCEPKPQQQPHPPIIVGGSSGKTLKVTAKYADRFDWGFVPTIEMYEHKLGLLKSACKAVGKDFSLIERSCWPSGQILLAKDQKELAQKVLKHKPSNQSLWSYKKYTLSITQDEVAQHLQPYLDLGVSYFMLFFAELPSLDSLRLFVEAVQKI